MKEKIVITQCLFLLSLSIYPLEFENNLSLGVLGFGVFPKNGNVGWYFWGHVGNFTYQSTNGFGLNISPFHIFYNLEDSGGLLLTFVNTSFFYNFLRNEQYILGPVGSMNAINYNHPGFFEVQAGIRFSIRNINFWDPDFYKEGIFGFDFLIAELGYRYNNKDSNGFYAIIGVDLLTGVYSYAASQKKEDIEKYQKKHPTY
jgi:hypothetical protein